MVATNQWSVDEFSDIAELGDFTSEEMAKTTIEMVDLQSVVVTDKYHRKFHLGHLKKMKAAFDPSAVGVLYGSRRADGTIHMIDGMHRREVCLEKGIRRTRMMMFHGLSEQREADLRLLYNVRAADTSYEKYRLLLEAERPNIVRLSRVIEGEGFRVVQGGAATPLEIGAPGAIMKISEIYHEGHLLVRDVLRVIRLAWGTRNTKIPSILYYGVAMFLNAYGDKVLLKDAATKWERCRPIDLVHEGGGGNKYASVATALLYAYNKGRHSKKLDNVFS